MDQRLAAVPVSDIVAWTPALVCARLLEAWCESPRSPASAAIINCVAEHLMLHPAERLAINDWAGLVAAKQLGQIHSLREHFREVDSRKRSTFYRHRARACRLLAEQLNRNTVEVF